jgi:hypothetical protein
MKIETIFYQLDWSKFRVGQSVFVPCIDHVAARRTLVVITKRLKISIVTKVVIVDGVKGLRIWRI